MEDKKSDVKSDSSKSEKSQLAPKKYKPNAKEKLMYLINYVKDGQKVKKKGDKRDKRPKVEIIEEEKGSGKTIEGKEET
mgnify:CR=1 FL=1